MTNQRTNFSRRILTTVSFFMVGIALSKIFGRFFKRRIMHHTKYTNGQIDQKITYIESEVNQKVCSKFYTINDLDMIKEIVNESRKSNGYFISHFFQPYLLVDSNFRFKITMYEHTNSINLFILKCYKNTRQEFTDIIISKELERFLNLKNSQNENKNSIELTEIAELSFKIGTTYLKSMFNNFQISEIYEMNDNDKKIFYRLMKIQEHFTLGLFLKPRRRLIRHYSKNLKILMKLIEAEYMICINDSTRNMQLLKFLFIKNFYLDILIVISVISNFLQSFNNSNYKLNLINEINSSKSSFLKSNEIWKYSYLKESIVFNYAKCLSKDLLSINSHGISRKINVNFNDEDLIGLNLKTSENFLNNYKLYAKAFELDTFYLDSNNLTLNLTYCLAYFLIKNFDFRNCKNYEDSCEKNSKHFKIISFYKNFLINCV